MVTTTSDAANGDTSTAANLMTNPGPDGISLREAIEVANNDPGSYAVRFSSALSGKSIAVGAQTRQDLPPIFGGGVTIDGDIDGDGRPDVTLIRTLPDSWCSCGIAVASSGNAISALTMRSFRVGVLFWAMVRIDDTEFATGRAYANNTVRGLVLDDIGEAGVAFRSYYHECVERACRTFNSWTDTAVTGNTIRSSAYGVDLAFEGSIGDRARRLTITGNDITIAGRGGDYDEKVGINLSAGFWIGSTGNRINGLVIADNTISVQGPSGLTGVRVWAGEAGASSNTVAGVAIVGNDIRVSPASNGVMFGTGDGATTDIDAEARPIRYPEENLVRDVEIRENVVEGTMSEAVLIQNSCCGGARNEIENVSIIGNSLMASGPHPEREDVAFVGVRIEGGTPGDGEERPTTENSIFDVSIVGNEIVSATGGFAIGIYGGMGSATRNEVACVRVGENDIVKPLRDAFVLADAGGASGNLATMECPGESPPPPTETARAADRGEDSSGERSERSSGDIPWTVIVLGVTGVLSAALVVMQVRARSRR